MDRGDSQAIVHGVTKSQRRLKHLSTHLCPPFKVPREEGGSTRGKEQSISQGVPQNLWWPRSPGETQRTGG